MATRGPFGRDLSDMYNYSDAVRKALNDVVKILPQPDSVATTKRDFYVQSRSCKLQRVDYVAVIIAYHAQLFRVNIHLFVI